MVAAEALAETPFFIQFQPRTRELLSPIATRKKFKAGETIYAEGSAAGAVGVLLSGRVAFQARQGDGETSVTLSHTEHPGDVFGWSSIVGADHTYTHSALCMEDAEVILLDGRAVLELCRAKPEIGVPLLEKLSAVLSQRLQSTRAQIRRRLRPGLISHG